MTLLERMVLGVERVRDRLLRTAAALEGSGLPYAIAGGNAVAAWVATVDAAAVRNTQDVDVLLRRADLTAAARALESAGFLPRHAAGLDLFLDGPDASPRDAVHIVFARERVRPEHAVPAPDVTESARLGEGLLSVVSLDALVRMKLNAYRRKDQVHLLDLIGVGLVDTTWIGRLPPPLAGRLQELIDNPEG